jgi:DNA-binding response OmpR family regulator
MKILVIEDEKEIRGTLKKNLEAECFAVDTASDGEMGLNMAKKSDYDLIVLDNLLPKKDGMQVCREVRAAGNHTPIVMLSVKSETATKVELLNAGADDYLSKPFSFEELLARVHALFRRPKGILNEIITVGDLSLDSSKHSVKRGNKVVYLTRKEFMLLEYLMRNVGSVLSRGMIMEHVWDMNADPFSNTIESHILSLRRKIENKANPSMIRTIPGRGYQLLVAA